MFDTVQVGKPEYLKESGNTDMTVRRSNIKTSAIRSIQISEVKEQKVENHFLEFLKNQRMKEETQGGQVFRFETSDIQPFDVDFNILKKLQEREDVCEAQTSSIIEQHGQNNCKQLLSRYYNENYMNMVDEESDIDCNEERNCYEFHMVNIKPIKLQYKKVVHEQTKKQQRFLHYLIKYTKQTQSVYFSDQITCSRHAVPGDFSKCIVLDKYTGRYYMYDNARFEVVVRSIRFEDQICRFKSSVRRKQPILYLLYKPGVVVVAGGYELLQDSEARGLDVIEIFKIDQWKVQTQPILAKLRTKRISPILLEMKVNQVDCLIILGGHKLGKFQKEVIKYGPFKQQNSIINQKAHAITIQSIEQAIELRTQQLLQPLNLNVKFDGDSMSLHNHIVIQKPSQYKGKQLLIITQSKRDLYQVIYTPKFNTIVINRTGEVLSQKNLISSKEDNRVTDLSESLVSLNKNGQLQITPINKKSSRECCRPF